MTSTPQQLEFDAMLADAASVNQTQTLAQETAFLPDNMDEAIVFHIEQIERHHQAMMTCDFDTAFAIREEARLLAWKLNDHKPGFLARDDAAGCVLEKACAADDDAVPLWGQKGSFLVNRGTMRIRIDMGGMLCIGAAVMPYLRLDAKAVDPDKPFISSTGFCSLTGWTVDPVKGITTADFAEILIDHRIRNKLKGRLCRIEHRYRGDFG